MIVTLLLMAMMQDGPVQTARPASTADFSAYAQVVRAREAQAATNPGPACTFGGRPVSRPGCPTPPGRVTVDAAGPEGPVLTRIEDCSDPAKRRPAEAEFECTSRFRTDAWVRSLQPEGEQIDWEFSADQAAPVYPPVRTPEDCAVAANRGPNEDEFDCALRLSYALQDEQRAGRPGFRTGRADGEVPAWALDDPAGWEVSQCGTAGDEACRRQARNRLAMARAGLAAEPPAASGSAPRDNCRMVMRRSEDGFGGSLSRVCGDEIESERALERLREATRPVAEPCDRPGSLETQDAWIARCRALPVR